MTMKNIKCPKGAKPIRLEDDGTLLPDGTLSFKCPRCGHCWGTRPEQYSIQEHYALVSEALARFRLPRHKIAPLGSPSAD